MIRFVYLDTETTGTNVGRLVQLCLKGPAPDELLEGLFRPPVPIETQAMAVHHITAARVAKAPSYKDWPMRDAFEEQLRLNVTVAHNAPFDIAVLAREGAKVGRWIDTLKVARRIWPELPSHQLQFLRYHLGGGNDLPGLEGLPAHDAKADVLVLELVFDEMLREVREKHLPASVLAAKTSQHVHDLAAEVMIQWSTEPALLHAVAFGKYKGRTWEEVARDDLGYLFWLQKQDCDEDLRHTIEYWTRRHQQRSASAR